MRDKRMDSRATAPHELLLIRIGHHLWRWRKLKAWPEPAIMSALEEVWAAKEAVRVILCAEHLETLTNRQNHLAKIRRPFGH